MWLAKPRLRAKAVLVRTPSQVYCVCGAHMAIGIFGGLAVPLAQNGEGGDCPVRVIVLTSFASSSDGNGLKCASVVEVSKGCSVWRLSPCDVVVSER